MKEVILEILQMVKEQEISPQEATKRVLKVFPTPSEMYNQANDSHYPAFQKYLAEHAAAQKQK